MKRSQFEVNLVSITCLGNTGKINLNLDGNSLFWSFHVSFWSNSIQHSKKRMCSRWVVWDERVTVVQRIRTVLKKNANRLGGSIECAPGYPSNCHSGGKGLVAFVLPISYVGQSAVTTETAAAIASYLDDSSTADEWTFRLTEAVQDRVLNRFGDANGLGRRFVLPGSCFGVDFATKEGYTFWVIFAVLHCEEFNLVGAGDPVRTCLSSVRKLVDRTSELQTIYLPAIGVNARNNLTADEFVRQASLALEISNSDPNPKCTDKELSHHCVLEKVKS
jgi:hypothetical protein